MLGVPFFSGPVNLKIGKGCTVLVCLQFSENEKAEIPCKSRRFQPLEKRETGFEPAAPTLARWCSTPEPLAHEQLNSTDEGYYNKKRSGCQAILLKFFQKFTGNLPGGGLAGKRSGPKHKSRGGFFLFIRRAF